MNKDIFKKIDFLPFFVICFCLGICLAKILYIPFLFLYILAWLLAIFAGLVLKKDNSSWILFGLGFILGALLLINTQDLSYNHIAKFTPYKSRLVFIEGIVDSDPVKKLKNTSFILKPEKLKIYGRWRKVNGKILVKSRLKENFTYGDRLFLEGKLYKPYSLGIGERLNYRDYLGNKDIYSILSIKRNSFIKRLGLNQGSPFVYFILRIRNNLKKLLNKNLSKISATILGAVILGQRENLASQVRDILVNTGTVHIIAISGLHLGIVAFLVLLILKITGIPRRIRFIITILVLIFYCVLTGARIPVVRATIMLTILLAGYILKRQMNIYNSLSLAALIILILNPRQVFQLSFQLSFVSIISIVWLTPKISLIFPKSLYKRRFTHIFINIFSVSQAVWLGLFGLIAYYFKLTSPIAILANMIVVPYMSIVIASAFIFSLSAFFCPSVVFIFSSACETLIIILLTIFSFFSRLPFAYFKLSNFSFYQALIYYSLLIIIFSLPVFQWQKL